MGAIGKNGQFRAGMAEYGTDPKANTRSYSRTQSLTPPPVDVRRGLAPPQTGEAPATPRAVQLPN
ncbi:hypothetical protein [Azospirillum thermophilum]|uniref:hypothetical protein n=1 Tax=Azospirillum thermophilum TaxID=2202148 RepID=UPI001FECB469|nr:hypothetical protein [Azospirillum thermophilum]